MLHCPRFRRGSWAVGFFVNIKKTMLKNTPGNTVSLTIQAFWSLQIKCFCNDPSRKHPANSSTPPSVSLETSTFGLMTVDALRFAARILDRT